MNYLKKIIISFIFILIIAMQILIFEKNPNNKADNNSSINVDNLNPNLHTLGEAFITNTYTTEPTPSSTVDVTNEVLQETLSFSQKSGYYKEGFELNITCANNYDILYTITTSESATGTYKGGGIPTFSTNLDAKTIKYEQPINILSTKVAGLDTVKVTVVRAAAFDGDKMVGTVQTNTYIVNTANNLSFVNRYTMPVISLVTDEVGLYNYETGIFVDGKVYADFKLKKISESAYGQGWVPRNFNQTGREWERAVHVDFFNTDGNIVISQEAGLRVSGVWSRMSKMKSLRIVARKDYDPQNGLFKFEVFPGLKSYVGDNAIINKFDSLVLRNSGGDFLQTMFCDVLQHKLAESYGVDGQQSSPAVVYLNGKYYGLMNIREDVTEEYVASHYGIPKEDITIIATKGAPYYKYKYVLDAGKAGEDQKLITDFKNIIKYDMANMDNYNQYADQKINIDGYVKYLAFEIYVNNGDWPHNNVAVWRYTGNVDNNAIGKDGKWRFVLKDLDWGFVKYNEDSIKSNVGLNGGYSTNPSMKDVLESLMKNTTFKTKFSNELKSLANNYMQPSKVLPVITAMKNQRLPEMKLFYSQYGGDYNALEGKIELFREFASQRPAKILSFMISNGLN